MNTEMRTFGASSNRAVHPLTQAAASVPPTTPEPPAGVGSAELNRALADIKGQAQFLLYLADQVEDCLTQLGTESDFGNAAFLCRLMGMYANQLETRHQGLGEKIAEACHEVYAAIRELDFDE